MWQKSPEIARKVVSGLLKRAILVRDARFGRRAKQELEALLGRQAEIPCLLPLAGAWSGKALAERGCPNRL
eukprot:scaffold455712_cov45-Prasinocladus_malaysianus.AAC.1